MSRPKPAVVPLHKLQPGPPADFFALLAEKARKSTRDGKPLFVCQFRDRVRSVSAVVWADSPHFADCERDWQPGMLFKVRATYGEHERYGPQVDLQQVRPVRDADHEDGLRESDFFERSRFDPDATFPELRALAESEIADVPLRSLVLGLLDAHVEALKKLPAHPRAFYPFPGGWLEHTLSVARSCLLLADRYVAFYPELSPPLNRDLIAAAAVLHDLGRVAELAPSEPGAPAETTIDGHLFGHLFLGRDLIRDAARTVPDLNPEQVRLLEHVVVSHLTKPEWGSARLPCIPEVLILHHADDLDAKLEMYVRCLTRDVADGPFTDPDPVLKRPLFKKRSV